MRRRSHPHRNEYRCTIERNRADKLCVRIQALFRRHRWSLSAYFLASAVPQALRRLKESLEFLQRDEERLWFWGEDRSGDPHRKEELLGEAGLLLDRRVDFPVKFVFVTAAPGASFSPAQWRGLERDLMQSVTARPGPFR